METYVAPTVDASRGNVVYARLSNICAWTQELFSNLIKSMGTHTLIAFASELPVILPVPCTVLEYTPRLLEEVVNRQTLKQSGSVTLVWLVKDPDFSFDREQESLFQDRYAQLRVNMIVVDVSHFFGPCWKNLKESPIQADALIDFACHGLCHRTQLTLPRPFTLVINDNGGLLNRMRKQVGPPLVVLSSMDRLRAWWEGHRQRPYPCLGVHVAVCMYHLQEDDPMVIELLTDTSVRKTVFVTHKNLQIMGGLPVRPDGVVFYCGYTHSGSLLKKKYVWEPFYSHEMDYSDFVGKCIMSRLEDSTFITTGDIPTDLLQQ